MLKSSPKKTLKELIQELTCKNCAGEGATATRVTTIVLGRHMISQHRLDCTECDGTGIARKFLYAP